MNVTQEQIQAAMEAMGGAEAMPTVDPIADIINDITKDDVIHNVTKVQGGELRCIVSHAGQIKPTTITDGATTQQFNEEEDIIAWVCIINNERHMLKQDVTGIQSTTVDSFGALFGNKTGYALSYLSSFNGDNNILLDDEKVKKFEDAAAYSDRLMGDSDGALKTLITSMCTNTENYEDVCEEWDIAQIFDTEVEDVVITWGCTAKTEDQYVEFENTYVVLWARPFVMDADGKEVPDELTQVVTRQVNPNNVPQLGRDSKATFTVDETLNEQIIAYAVITEDTLSNGVLTGIRLYKTIDFDVNKTSF